MPDQTESTPQESNITRQEEFDSLYANHVNFETTVWDLKLIFGQVDQSDGKPVIQQHTAITIPWATAKLMGYYLQINLAFHEAEGGKLHLPDRVLPPDLDPTVLREMESDPKAHGLLETLRNIRAQFLASLK